MDKDSSRGDKRIASQCVGGFLFVIAAFLGISLLLAIFAFSGTQGGLALPGSILFSAYGFSALLVPALILYAAILLIIPGWTLRSGILLAGSCLPFFTVVAGEKLLINVGLTIGNESVSRFVSTGFVVSTFLAVLIEYILLLHITDLVLSRLTAPAPAPVSDEPLNDAEFDYSIEAPLADSNAADATALGQPYETEIESETDSDSDADSSVDDKIETEIETEIEIEAVLPVDSAASSAHEALPSGILPIEIPPMYVDFEKMKAPFDLPITDEWVETLDAEEPVDEIDLSTEDEVPVDSALVDGADYEDDLIEDDLIEDDGFIGDDQIDIDGESDATEDEAVLADVMEVADLVDDLPPVLSVPPVVADPTPVPETPFWRKKQRGVYSVPYDILTSYPDGEYWIVDEATRRSAAALKETLNEFRIQADVTGIRKGPVITMFEILPAPGVKLSKIVGLQDNIALRLAASSVRIVAPIPGKHAVGIEVPNQRRSIVSFRELIETDTPASKKMEIPVVLGKDITGEAQVLDLALTPHLLIAGSTGSGKSVCVNSIILSILYKRSPEDVKLILIDPKIVELKLYNDIGHLLAPVITEPKKAFQSLQYCLCEMERRYALLDGMGVRDIKSYNRRIKERNIATEKLPYLVVIIDEFADLMATTGKELESTVARLAAMSRAVGIHLVLATQRPSIDVITGLIKANIPTRIAFMVASKMDSRIIIDQVGAEKLLGRGDMLYASATDPFPVRIQGAFVSEEEVERVVAHVKTLGAPEYIDEEIFVEDDDDAGVDPSLFSDGEDPLYEKALEIVLLAGKASASYIQRRLKIGYNRAARLVEDMEARGLVGPANGSKPREVLHHP